MIDLALFLVVSAAGLAFTALVFVFKDILHSAIALSGLFLINSLFFIMLNQPILAVIQLFIMIGGITTFLFIGVASAAYSNFKYTKLVSLGVLSAVIFIVMILPVFWLGASGSEANIFYTDTIAQSFTSTAGTYYLMLLVMFGVSLGAILLLKKAGADK